MADIKALRERAMADKARLADSIRKNAIEVLTSEAATLTLLNNTPDSVESYETQVAEVANKLTNKLVEDISSYTNKFREVCTNKGLNKFQIMKAAKAIYEFTGLATQSGGEPLSDDEILNIVAQHIECNAPYLYNELGVYGL